jgi:hypothetical protein
LPEAGQSGICEKSIGNNLLLEPAPGLGGNATTEHGRRLDLYVLALDEPPLTFSVCRDHTIKWRPTA